MANQNFVLGFKPDRDSAIRAIAVAPTNSRVTISPPKRSLSQNDIFHAIMTEIIKQWTNQNYKYDLETFKREIAVEFAKEMKMPVKMIPSLDGMSYRAYVSTKDFSKEEGSQFIEYLYAFGAARGVVFKDERKVA